MVPTLLLHAMEDRVLTIDIASRRSISILPQGSLVEIEGAPHGMCVTHADRIHAELLKSTKA